MKRRILPLLLVLCLLWLTGCSFDDTSDEDLLQEIYGYYQSGKDKTDAPLTSFALPVLQGQTLDPITSPDGVQQTIGALLYEGLYALDTGFTPQPMLAESCTVSGTTCTITLRGGVTFSDGSTVTASDVVRSLQRAQSSERYGARLAGVSRIAAGSGGTVVLTLAYENQNIAALLDIPIVKAGTETATAPIGTGPYVYTAGESGSVSLTRNSSWWKGESLPLQTIPLETYKDSDTIAYAFYAREIHGRGHDGAAVCGREHVAPAAGRPGGAPGAQSRYRPGGAGEIVPDGPRGPGAVPGVPGLAALSAGAGGFVFPRPLRRRDGGGGAPNRNADPDADADRQ